MPDLSKRYESLMMQAEAMRQHAIDRLPDLWARPVDEMSILFRSRAEHIGFTEWARARGLVFNEVTEKQKDLTAPGHGFTTNFTFVKKRIWDWRIEAMVVTSGRAPLHTQLNLMHGDFTIAHASWKLKDVEIYHKDKCALEDAGFRFHKEYRNGYGQFAYFSHPEFPFYFKPRVNLRDAEAVA